MKNTLRNFILEVDISEHRTLRLEWVQMDFSMAVLRISVEQVKATAVVITATLIISQVFIGICPITKLIEVAQHVLVQDHRFLTRWIQSVSLTLRIIAPASHRGRGNIWSTADVSAARITISAGKLQPGPRRQLSLHH
jgi:hypothetical protein